MKITTLVLMASIAMSTAATAQDRPSENRAAVRRMFPIVSLFDKKKAPAAETAAADATVVSAAPAGQSGNALATLDAIAAAPGDTRDIAGVRLGMTPDQVTRAAAAAGYARTETGTQYSWASNVRQEEEQRGFPKLFPASAAPVLGAEDYKGSGSQKLHVEYAATPRGAYATSVRYSVNMAETPWDTMKERTRAKYGREGYGTASSLVFCSRGETKCDVFGRYVQPTVRLDMVVGGSWLILEQGSRYREAYRAAMNGEVDRLHPRNERPAF